MASFTWPSMGGGGSGGTGSIVAAGTFAIPNGVSTVTVAYSSTLTAPGIPVCSVVNLVDATPIFLQVVITAMTDSGFTALLSAPTDSANYSLNYMTTPIL